MTRRFERRFHGSECYDDIAEAVERRFAGEHRKARKHTAPSRPDHLVRRVTDANSQLFGKLVNRHDVPVDWTRPKLLEADQEPVQPLPTSNPPIAPTIETWNTRAHLTNALRPAEEACQAYADEQRAEIAELLAASIIANELISKS